MITLSIALSERCNLRCSYCNTDKTSSRTISYDRFLNEYQKFRREKPQERIKIDFYGGEPLLHWDLIKKITQELEKDNCKFFIPTNGILLTSEIVEFFNNKNFEVSISYDGLWQDINRRNHDQQKTHDLIFSKKDLINGIDQCSIHTMIYKGCYNLLENHQYILNTMEIAPQMTLIRDVGVWDTDNIILLKKGISELVDWCIINNKNSYSNIPHILQFYLRDFLRYLGKNNNDSALRYCGAGEIFFSFTQNRIIPCNRFKDNTMIEKIPYYIKMPECTPCNAYQYCRKGCLFENIKNGGPIKELCIVYNHIYSEVARMIKNFNDQSDFKDYLRKELVNA